MRKYIVSRFSGSRQDPLIYLGGIAFVLFIVIPFLPVSITENSIAGIPVPVISNLINHLSLGPSTGAFQLPDVYLIQKNSLKAVSPSGMIKPQVLASLLGSEEEVNTRGGIIEYAVEQGDSLWSIADKFGISLETVLWANNLSKSSIISPGKKLVILPVSGTTHIVKAGETLGEIVKKYKGDVQEVIAFNELENENEVFAGDIVIIPNGILPLPPVVKLSPVLAPLAAGYFICPIVPSAPGKGCRITQRLHWYNAIDFSNGKCWEPIYAAASGTVQKAKSTTSASKWAFGGAGNHITILHPNGTVTFYGHLASLTVGSGDSVSQGQIIGYIGGARYMAGSGNSTGCHLHFQVTGARNPFAP